MRKSDEMTIGKAHPTLDLDVQRCTSHFDDLNYLVWRHHMAAFYSVFRHHIELNSCSICPNLTIHYTIGLRNMGHVVMDKSLGLLPYIYQHHMKYIEA